MATVNKNLSNYDFSLVPSARGMKFGIVVAEWNENITEGLFKGAMDALLNCGCEKSNIIRKNVPGSFELPLAAQFFFESTDVDAVICLGSVIQGETKHFDYVCQSTALGIKDVSLKYNKPVIFGVLTDNTALEESTVCNKLLRWSIYHLNSNYLFYCNFVLIT